MINPKATVEATTIGNGSYPLIVIDDFLAEPDALIEIACQSQNYANDDSDFYPGLRSPMPAEVRACFTKEFTFLLSRVLGKPELSLRCLFHSFSLTITPANELKPIQSIPHFDDEDANKLAMVLYLFRQDFGGTSFYRHNKTGFEAITQSNSKSYTNTLMSQATTEGLPEAAYINGDSHLFSRYHCVKSAFNRCILYPSNILHSGDINTDKGLSAQPSQGRLTANMALQIEP